MQVALTLPLPLTRRDHASDATYARRKLVAAVRWRAAAAEAAESAAAAAAEAAESAAAAAVDAAEAAAEAAAEQATAAVGEAAAAGEAVAAGARDSTATDPAPPDASLSPPSLSPAVGRAGARCASRRAGLGAADLPLSTSPGTPGLAAWDRAAPAATHSAARRVPSVRRLLRGRR